MSACHTEDRALPMTATIQTTHNPTQRVSVRTGGCDGGDTLDLDESHTFLSRVTQFSCEQHPEHAFHPRAMHRGVRSRGGVIYQEIEKVYVYGPKVWPLTDMHYPACEENHLVRYTNHHTQHQHNTQNLHNLLPQPCKMVSETWGDGVKKMLLKIVCNSNFRDGEQRDV